MNVRNRSTPDMRLGIALVFALAASLPASGQGNYDLWEISSKMEMPGMPMAMPGQTSRVCVGKMRMTMKETRDTMDMTYVGKRVGDCTAPTK